MIMRAGKETLLLAAMLVFAAVSGSALDVGGNLSSRTDLDQSGTALLNSASVWARNNPITDNDPILRYVLEAEATSRLTFRDGGQDSELYADIALANLRATLPGIPDDRTVSEFTVGRYTFAEETGLIFSDTVDGTEFRLDYPAVAVRGAGGYSGLIDGRNTGIIMTDDDRAAVFDEEQRAGSRRVVTALSATVLQLADRHDLTAGSLAQWDMRDESEAGEVLDSQYVYVAAAGAIGDLYYTTGVTGAANQRDGAEAESGFALAALSEGELFIGDQDRHIVTLTTRYGSGSGETLDEYVAISADSFDAFGVTRVGDAFTVGVDYEVKPFAGLEGAAGDWVGVSGYSVADWPADFAGGEPYRSLEVGGRLAARPFSDFGGQLRVAGISGGDEPGTIDVLGRIEVSARF